MKTASGSLRIDLAQYREMAVFTQFSSDLDQNTRDLLTQGKVLMELLKQPLGHPMSLADQVITLVTALNKKLMSVEPKHVKEFQGEMLTYFAQRYPEIGKNLEISKVLDDDAKKSILSVADEFLKVWDSEHSTSGSTSAV